MSVEVDGYVFEEGMFGFVRPDLVFLWDDVLNEGIDFSLVKSADKTEYFWRCHLGHSWKAIPKSLRRTPSFGCPVCAGRVRLKGFNDLPTLHPNLVAQWSISNNVSIYEVPMRKKVWWNCGLEEHDWCSSTLDRAKLPDDYCPFCSGSKVLYGFNDLLSQRKDNVMAEWDYESNVLDPSEVFLGSQLKFHWKCKHGHVWESKIPSVATNDSFCPFCNNKKVLKGFNDLRTSHGHLEFCWSTRNESEFSDFHSSSSVSCHWMCPDGLHEFLMPIKNRVLHDSDFCAVCDGGRVWQTKLPVEIAAMCVNVPDKFLWNTVLEWFSKNCGHTWETSVKRMSKHKDCFVCSSRIIVPNLNDVFTLFPHLVSSWLGNESSLVGMHPCSNTVGHWKCDIDESHVWKARICDRVKGDGCPICSRHKIIAGVNDVFTLFPHLKTQVADSDVLKKVFPISSQESLNWKCDNNHVWQASIDSRTYKKYGCPKCVSLVSKSETEIAEFMKKLGLNIITSDRSVIKPLELDVYIPERNIAIEFNGLYWHSERYKKKNYHYDKYVQCAEKGVQLLQIWEDDWRDKRKIVETMLAHKLGVSRVSKVYGRNTEVSVLSYSEVKHFLDEHHIQGKASGSLYLGLVADDELVAVMVVKQRSEGVWELVRYATGMQVLGGFSKLLKYFECNYEWQKIVSFADLCVSDGGLYVKHGFRLDKVLEPDYRYAGVSNSWVREHKFGYRLHRFRSDPGLEYEDGLTERELAKLNGLLRVYDAGKQRWVKTNS